MSMLPSNKSMSMSMPAAKRQELLSLDTQKKSLQSEAEAIVSELTAELPDGGPPIGIDSPLIDAEGFPRADIDVYRARTLRKRFKEIQTDHKALERKIEVGLVQLTALTNSSANGSSSNSNRGQSANSNSNDATNAKDDDDEEKRARAAHKPKPKFDAKTGKWVVKSWDGSVAGAENGEMRSFDDLTAESNAALASNLGGGSSSRVGGGSSISTNNVSVGNENGGSDNTQPQQQQQTQTSSMQQQQLRQQMQQVTFQNNNQSTTPFAIIDQVSPNSPASDANLLENDVILRFGAIDHANHREFRAIAELVPIAASQNESITVVVRRTTTALGGVVEVIKTEIVELIPKTWGGRGLLGCHIQPYTE